MQYLTSLLTVLGLATVALCADVEIDARFYTNDNTDDGCDNYATGCTDLAENSCCGVSQSGTRLYDSGDFYNTASGMGVTIQGKFFSRQNINDCGVVVCNNIDAGTCCNEQLSTLSGASYSRPSKKRDDGDVPQNTTCVAPDSHMWVESDKSYYIKIQNEHKHAAIMAMRELGDFANLGLFMKANADQIKPEGLNDGPTFGGRFRRV